MGYHAGIIKQICLQCHAVRVLVGQDSAMKDVKYQPPEPGEQVARDLGPSVVIKPSR